MMIKRLLYLRNTFASLAVLLVLLVSSNGFGQTTGTLTITRSSFASTVTAYGTDDVWSATTSQGDIITGYFDIFTNNTVMQTRTATPIGSYPYNNIVMPGPITKITITKNSGTDRAWTPYLATVPLTKSNFSTNGTSQSTKTPTNTVPAEWIIPSSSNYKYFYLSLGGGATEITSIVIEYQIPVTATTSLANNGTPIAAGNITQGTNNNILGSFTLAQSGANTTLTQASFLIDGNFVNGDVVTNGIKLYTNTTNDFATATSLGSVSVTTAAVITFSGLTQTLTKDATRYFWVTADIAIGASPGNTINLYQMNYADLVVSPGTISSSTTVSGTKTIVATVSPTISLSDASLPNFDNVCINTESTIKEYLVEGVNLTNDIIITAPTGFKIRKEGDVAYSTTVTLTPSAGEVLEIIEVIFNPTVAGASGSLNITHESTGATTKNVSVSGTTASGTVTLTSNTASAITTTSATSGGNTLSTTCGTITAKGVVWDTAANPTVALSTKTNDGTGVANYSSNITGLTENTVYNFRAYATNSNGVTSYGANATFTTLSKAPTAPIANTATVNGFTASWTAPAGQGAAALTYTVKNIQQQHINHTSWYCNYRY